MNARFCLCACLVLLAPGLLSISSTRAAGEPPPPELDTDGDGLGDFQELNKYKTDPKKKDTAGKGLADGDWQQRREFSYSVRAVIRIMPPYNLAALNDDYQDVRVLAKTENYAELEVTLYPLNANAQAITANPNWQKDYAGMKDHLAPGVTTNWDDAMRKDLLLELAKAGIVPESMTDKEVAEKVSRWLYSRSQHRNMFCTHFLHFPKGKPAIYPGLEKAFDKEKGDLSWSAEEQIRHEALGKEMFQRKVYGTCTSAAVAQATVLRALGLPTRFIVTMPLVDASDPQQLKIAEKGLTNHEVRSTVMRGVLASGKSYANHTYLEVFVGNRWRRLNYSTLGQNTLDANYFGLMVHIHTFNDLSEANLAPTWGARYALGKRDEVFAHSNPYRTIALEDHFGKYGGLPNPPAKEHKRLTLTKVYWPDAKDAPEAVKNFRSGSPPESGRLFVHVEEWLDDAGDYLQYKPFLEKADHQFVLRSPGKPDVRCQASKSFLTLGSQKLREFEIVIPPAEFAKMAMRTAYRLSVVNPSKEECHWEIPGDLSITRPLTAEEKMEALLEKLEGLEKRVEQLEKKKSP